jgi:hypothetical protein
MRVAVVLVGVVLGACAHDRSERAVSPESATPSGAPASDGLCPPDVYPPVTEPAAVELAQRANAGLDELATKVGDPGSPKARLAAATALQEGTYCEGRECVHGTDPLLAAAVPQVLKAVAAQLKVEKIDEIRGALVWALRKWGRAASGEGTDEAAAALVEVAESDRDKYERDGAILALAEYSRVHGPGFEQARAALARMAEGVTATGPVDEESAQALLVLRIFDRAAYFDLWRRMAPAKVDHIRINMMARERLARHALAVDPEGLKRDRDAIARDLPSNVSFEVNFDCPRDYAGDVFASDPKRDTLSEDEAAAIALVYGHLPTTWPMKLLIIPLPILRRLPHESEPAKGALVALTGRVIKGMADRVKETEDDIATANKYGSSGPSLDQLVEMQALLIQIEQYTAFQGELSPPTK